MAVGDVNRDGKGEVIVGSGPGVRAIVRVFDVRMVSKSYTPTRQYLPFNASFNGGVFVAAGDVNGDGFAEIIVGAGNGRASLVEIYNGDPLAGRFGHLPTRLVTFTPFVGTPAQVGPQTNVRLAVKDLNGDGVVDRVVLAQNIDARTRRIRSFQPLSGTVVDFLFDNDPDFAGGLFLA